MDWIARDLKVGLRMLLRNRGFSVTTALTLAVCIGANVALFSVVHHVLLRPLPVPEPERILLMSNLYPRAGATESSNSGVPDYYDRLREVSAFEEQALFNRTSVSIGQDGLPTRIRALNATPSYFRMMRVGAALGRTFVEEEGALGNEKKVVLSDTLWRSQFGADPAAVGKDLRLDGQPYLVVGVMPKSFEALTPGVSLWRPLAFTAEQRSDSSRHSNNYWNVGRLKPGVTLDQAQAQVDALNAANLERFPQYKELLMNAGFNTRVQRLSDHLVRSIRGTVYLLWGGALFVLLIGCVNVANLALVRTRARLKELATRLALGASRALLLRQLVIESVLLTLLATGAGLLIGALGLRSLGALNLQDLPYGGEIRLDGVAASYALALALGIAGLLGLLPLASVLPGNLTTALREEGRGSSGGRGARTLRRGLVVAQVAFTFILLVGAGLLLASFRKVLEVDPGFESERVLTATVSLPRTRYEDLGQVRRFPGEALQRVRALPGVVSAGATDMIPFGGSSSDSVIFAEGYVLKPGESVISPHDVNVTPGYFETMNVRLVQGRFFQDGDVESAAPAIIVDERLAKRFWPQGDALGRRMYQPTDINNLLAVTKDTVFYTVVGVVADVKLIDISEGDKRVGTYFRAMAQDGARSITFALKTAGRPEALTNTLRETIAALDPELPVFDVRTMEQRTEQSLLNRRTPALLSLAFGSVALLLSAVGIYGVLAYLVTQRKREIGIRMALGSSTRAVFELVLREGLLLVGLGFGLGALGAIALRRSLETQLFGVRATDPLVLSAVATLLVAVALVACSLPARRATRIDPSRVLTE